MRCEDATRIILDVQGRLRDTVKQYYKYLIEVIEEDNTRSVITVFNKEGDVEGVVVSKQFIPDKIKNTIYNPDNFINPVLIEIVSNISSNAKQKELNILLLKISNHSKNNLIMYNKIIDNIIDFNVNYLMSKGIRSNETDIGGMLIIIRGGWSSSKLKDDTLLNLKKELRNIISEVMNIKTDWIITSHMISFVLYIMLKSYYKINL